MRSRSREMADGERGDRRGPKAASRSWIVWLCAGALCLCAWCGSAADEPEPDSALANPSFEGGEGVDGQLPPAWGYYSTHKPSISVTTKIGRTGSQAAEMTAQGVAQGGQGLIQRIPVNPGEVYTFTAYVRNNPDAPLGGSAWVQLVIEWLDAAGRELTRTWGQPQDKMMSRLRWSEMSIANVKPPPRAVKAVFGVHLYEGDKGGKGSVLVDDVGLLQNGKAMAAMEKKPTTRKPTRTAPARDIPW